MSMILSARDGVCGFENFARDLGKGQPARVSVLARISHKEISQTVFHHVNRLWIKPLPEANKINGPDTL